MKSQQVPIGTEAPDFSLSPDGSPEQLLSAHRGKSVVLLFYRGHWCQVCRRQLGQLAAAYDTIRTLDAAIVAISADTPDATRDALGAHACPFPLVSDPHLTIIDMYGVRDEADESGRRIARPATFVLDAAGIVRFCHVGVDYQDRPAIGAILLALESLAGVPIG